jgi:hypothetical protein
MKIAKNYHSALVDEISNLKELDYYQNEKSFAISHNITDGILFEYYKADVIYSEPAWRSGYNLFSSRANSKNNNYNLYLESMLKCIKELKKPSFIITGKHAINKLNPDFVTEIKLHEYSSLLAIWNYEEIKFKNNSEAIEFISKKFNTVLDFNCGYGNAISKFNNFIASDVNKKCIYYIAKNFMNYGF